MNMVEQRNGNTFDRLKEDLRNAKVKVDDRDREIAVLRKNFDQLRQVREELEAEVERLQSSSYHPQTIARMRDEIELQRESAVAYQQELSKLGPAIQEIQSMISAVATQLQHNQEGFSPDMFDQFRELIHGEREGFLSPWNCLGMGGGGRSLRMCACVIFVFGFFGIFISNIYIYVCACCVAFSPVFVSCCVDTHTRCGHGCNFHEYACVSCFPNSPSCACMYVVMYVCRYIHLYVYVRM